jgi:hypothetical protein
MRLTDLRSKGPASRTAGALGDIVDTDGDRGDADDAYYEAAADPLRLGRNCVGSLPGPMRRCSAELPTADLTGCSKSEIEPDCILKPRHFAWAQQAATPVQPWLVDSVQVGRVDVAHVMAGQADVAV